jgi:hypothetical protein
VPSNLIVYKVFSSRTPKEEIVKTLEVEFQDLDVSTVSPVASFLKVTLVGVIEDSLTADAKVTVSALFKNTSESPDAGVDVTTDGAAI